MHQRTWPFDLERRVATPDQHAVHLELLYDISRTLISSGNLHELLTRLLDRTVAALGATRGSIMVLKRDSSGTGYVIRAGAGVESASPDISRVLRYGVAGHVISSRETILIDDVRKDPRWVPSSIDQGPSAPRSALVVPLIHEETVIGVLTLWHTQTGYFDYTAAELINAVAAQAAMAIERAAVYEQAQQRAEELARLNRERDVLYAQECQRRAELATLYEAALDIATGTNLDDTLARVAERAIRLVAADSACIYLMNRTREELVLATTHNLSARQLGACLRMGEGVAGKAAQERTIINIQDYPRFAGEGMDFTNDPAWAVAAIPLISGEVVVGVLIVRSNTPGKAFTEQHTRLLEMLGAQAAIVIENSQLLNATRRQMERMSAVARASAPLSTLLNPPDALKAVVREGMNELGADRCCILYHDQDVMNCPVAVGLSQHFVDYARRFMPMHRFKEPTKAIAFPDMLADSRLAVMHETFRTEGLRACLVLPLHHDGARYGSIALFYNRVRNFDPDELEAGRIFANQASISLVNARLYADLQRSNIELAQASRLKSEFLSIVSHELRTPMISITGHTEMLSEGFYGPLPDELVDPVRRVQRNAQHLLKLINDVLDLSMIEAGHLQLEVAPFNLPRVIEDLCMEIRPNALTRNLLLQHTSSVEAPLLLGDARRLRQLLYHLVTNGIKFTERGQVAVRVKAALDEEPRRDASADSRQMICIEVADTGIGIPIEFQRVIFDAFSQVDASATRRYSGIGVGLAIVSRLVALMGGTVELQSQVGVGSTFRVTLPFTVAD